MLGLTLNVGYNIDPSANDLFICRLRLYTTILIAYLSVSFLILASIDRVLITSSNALIRQRSTRRNAYISIVIVTLFWTIFHIHAIVKASLIPIGPNLFYCYYAEGSYLAFVGYFSIIKEISALLLLILFGLWSIRNVQSLGRIRPAFESSVSRTVAESSPQSSSSKDRQLVLMLFMDISIYASFSFMFAIFLMYQQITQDYVKSMDRIQIETVVRNICLFSIGIPFCTSCYTNLIASKTFRKEVKKVLPFKGILGIE